MSQIVWPRKARSIETLDGGGCLKFTVLQQLDGEPPRPIIAVGFSDSPVQDDPRWLRYGVMIKGNEFAIMENLNPSFFRPLPIDGGQTYAYTFRIYRDLNGYLITLSTAPRYFYETSDWADFVAPRWDGDDNDDYAAIDYELEGDIYWARRSFGYFDGIQIKGIPVAGSGAASYSLRPLTVDSYFSKDATDIYGDDANGEIYGTTLLPLTPSYGSSAQTFGKFPMLRVRITDAPAIDSVFGRLPRISSFSSDLPPDSIRSAIPTLRTVITDTDINNLFVDSIRMKMPLLLSSSSAWNNKATKIPHLKTKIVGVDFIKATIPSLRSRLGDSLNLAYAVIPSLKSSSSGESASYQLAYGQVTIPMNFVIKFNGKTGDDPLGGEDTPPMETSALVCVIDGEISVFSAMELSTAAMLGILGGDIGVIREATLQTVDMIGILGGEIDTQAESTLPAEVMFLMLGGSIGGEASSPQDVVQWAGVAEFDAANEVFCASIENGGVGGTTRYRAYAFNSFATISGKHYGANANGLFLLDGNTDSAERIAAQFGFGQLDFGKPNLKTISYCYLGAKAGAMRLSIDSLVDGKPTLSNYAARGHGSSIREVRFDLGRGLRSTYVMPTFYNTNGDDFEVDTVRFLIAESTRRI